jgi:ribosomal protein L11 methylase PrmA
MNPLLAEALRSTTGSVTETVTITTGILRKKETRVVNHYHDSRLVYVETYTDKGVITFRPTD